MDENYILVKGYDIEYGRGFTNIEIQNGSPRAIIGTDIVKLLFKGRPNVALGKVILVGNIRVQVVGILKS